MEEQVKTQKEVKKLNFVDKFLEYLVRRKREKQIKQLQLKQNIKRKELVQHLENTMTVINFIDGQLKTRKEKKTFWREFINNKNVRQETLKLLLTHYEELDKKIKEKANKTNEK